MDRLRHLRLQDGATATGNGTAVKVTALDGGMPHAALQVEGISGDTITFEGTIDDSNWYSVPAMNMTTGISRTTATADGVYMVPVTGLFKLRARISTYSAGTITVTGMLVPYTYAPATVPGSNDDIVVEVTLSLDTSIYAAGDVLADRQEVANAARVDNGVTTLHSVVILDKDDQAGALDLVFLRTDVTLGTENATISISDANADEICGIIEVAAGDYVDLTNSQLVEKANLGMVMQAPAGSTSLYVGAVSRDTKTYTASGITLKLGFLRS